MALTSQPLSLEFQKNVRVAGETLAGHVDLNLLLAQEDRIEHVRVKLRGSVHTRITRTYGNTTVTYRRTIQLVRSDTSLWTQGSAFPPPGSHVLRLPFEFTLPSNLPPSFHCGHFGFKGAISYSIELVGERPGLFKNNRRIRNVFPVVPAASPRDINVKATLMSSWAGEWRVVEVEKRIRQGLWGDYSRVQAQFELPDLVSLPIATPIPFRLHVVTHTKPMKRSDAPDNGNEKALFPNLPSAPSRVELHLVRHVRVRTRHHSKSVTENVVPLGGMGPSESSTGPSNVRTEMEEAEWIPAPGDKDQKDRGMWKRLVHFESTLTLSCPPSFINEIVDCQYYLRLRVPFHGLLNDLKSDIPITIVSGVGCPPPPFGAASSSNATYTSTAAPAPPLVMDLPPSYWEAEDHDWDADEKDEKD